MQRTILIVLLLSSIALNGFLYRSWCTDHAKCAEIYYELLGNCHEEGK